MKQISFIVLLIAIIVLSSFSPLEQSRHTIKIVVIDAGHGGKDPGCHGATSNEAAITLKVALELGRILKENLPELTVVYTRTTDVFVELHDRAALANKNNAQVFISIHCNSGPNNVHGTETFTMGLTNKSDNLELAKRENSVILKEDNYQQKYEGFDPNSPIAHILMANYQKVFMDNSINLASKIEDQFKKKLNRNSRGVKQAGLLVLWKTYMPSVLVEIGFLTNIEEERFMNNRLNRVYIASCIYRAFKEYKNEFDQNN